MCVSTGSSHLYEPADVTINEILSNTFTIPNFSSLRIDLLKTVTTTKNTKIENRKKVEKL